MLPAFEGRINRKTFAVGNLIGLAILGFAALIYIVPLAIADIVINGSHVSLLFKLLYGLFVIPAVFYLFFAAVLFVKRMHDIGYPGLLLLFALVAVQVFSRLSDLWQLNIISFVIILGVCALPGQKNRNDHGPKPGKKFKLDNVTVRF